MSPLASDHIRCNPFLLLEASSGEEIYSVGTPTRALLPLLIGFLIYIDFIYVHILGNF